jgi:thiamine pyrophosphokinase
MSPATIWITAALGKRLDQTLGSIFLLNKPDLGIVDIRLIDGHQEVFLVRKSASFQGAPGQRVSLLPLVGPVQGIHTVGLKYPLLDETLYPHKSRGISNQMTSNTASLTIKRGVLICIHEL